MSKTLIMTLCPTCLNFYRNHPEEYFIRRITPWNGPKYSCSKCDRYGFDYEITDKNEV